MKERVEKETIDFLSDFIDLIFDKWSCEPYHFNGDFSKFRTKKLNNFKKVWLSSSLMVHATMREASGYHEFHPFLLLEFGKEHKVLVDLIGTKKSTNLVYVRHFGRFIVGCTSHRFKMTVQDLLSERHFIIKKKHLMIKRFSYSLTAALVGRFATVAAETNNITRWGFTYNKVLRYN